MQCTLQSAMVQQHPRLKSILQCGREFYLIIITKRVYSDNSVKTMPNSTKRRPEMDFPCHLAYKNGHRSLVLLHSVIYVLYLFHS